MTTRKPPACHYDRRLSLRVTREHRDDCLTNQCDGCAPCTAPHCTVCGRGHTNNDHPLTCVTCIGRVRRDLADLEAAHTDLAREAIAGGADGRLVAAAPIPGGDAQVLTGPCVMFPQMRTYRGWTSENFAKDHPVSPKTGRPSDPMPPLAVLAQWEDMWRAWLGHPRGGRATITRAVGYLRDHTADLAQETDGPDFVAFARQVRDIRARLEQALHDEADPEYGVECFECGDRLVRRFRRRRPCHHHTPARAWYATVRSYPELQLYAVEAVAVLAACPDCDQGGITDPSAGLSWECPGCRKDYDPGEYATAVRRDLLEGSPDGAGWTHVTIASAAASTLTGRLVPVGTVRKWMDRGQVWSLCEWVPGKTWGMRLVYWPTVSTVATEAAAKAERRESRRGVTGGA